MKYAYVLASDKNQLDLAKETMDSLERVSSYPIAFDYVDNGWFDKPKVILKALEVYESVCWLDNDISILKNFDEIFTLTTKPIAGIQDYMYPSCINTGVLVVNQQAIDLIHDWIFYTDTKAFRSDQEALQYIRNHNPHYFAELPMIYNHQKFAIKNNIAITDKTKIIHWTGEDGKAFLRSKYRAAL